MQYLFYTPKTVNTRFIRFEGVADVSDQEPNWQRRGCEKLIHLINTSQRTEIQLFLGEMLLFIEGNNKAISSDFNNYREVLSEAIDATQEDQIMLHLVDFLLDASDQNPENPNRYSQGLARWLLQQRTKNKVAVLFTV